MKNKVLCARVEPEQLERVKDTAKEAGMNTAQYLRYLVSMEKAIDPIVKDLISAFKQTIPGIQETGIISAILIDFGARLQAIENILDECPEVFMPFAVDTDTGKQITGDQLYVMLRERWTDFYKKLFEKEKGKWQEQK